ncbi:MAG: DNA-binding protein [Lachnospiraceae bacterium]|nr:DNA-binding protein [Lachnospiraceae bacterium]
MDYYTSERIGRTFILKLVQGDCIRESIEKLVEKEQIRNAVIVSGIATLDRSRMHMISTTDHPMDVSIVGQMDTPLEVASIDGLIVDGMVHIHMVTADKDRAYGGHVLERCRILYLGEIVIQELLGLDIVRREVEPGIFHISER